MLCGMSIHIFFFWNERERGGIAVEGHRFLSGKLCMELGQLDKEQKKEPLSRF